MFLKVTENFCKVLTRPEKGNTVLKKLGVKYCDFIYSEAVTELDTLPEPMLTLQVVRHFNYSLNNVFNA